MSDGRHQAAAEPEAEWKGLSRAEELRLLNAAQTLRVRPGRGTNQGVRDHAAIAALLGCGLRVSELLNINREQYTGRGFKNVLVKGGRVREFVPVQAQARLVREEWLATRPKKFGPLFTRRTGKRLTRYQLFLILKRVAAQANTHRRAGEGIKVSPHVLRHSFLRKLAEEKGVQYAKEASGHRSDRYIWKPAWLEQQTGVRYETLRRHYGRWMAGEVESELRRFAAFDPTRFGVTDPKLLSRQKRAATGRAQLTDFAPVEECERGDLNPKRRLK